VDGSKYVVSLIAMVTVSCALVGCAGGGSVDAPPQGGYEFAGRLLAPFQLPFGVAVDGGGAVYVTDAGNQRVVKFTSLGIPTLEWGSQGNGNGEFLMPTGIATGSSGNIYVADYFSGRTQVFDRTDGSYRITLAGSTGGPGNIANPYGIAYTRGFFETSRLWITDFTGHRVHMNTPTQGWSMWGGFGGGNGQFRNPCGIACARDGITVYVVDRGNHRIQQFSDTGNFIRQWGGRGDGPGQFEFPEGIAVNQKGQVLVADTQNHRVQKFTSKGVFIKQFGHFGDAEDPWGLNEPHGIAVAESGNTYVCDYGNDIVRIYIPEN